uniref:Uncharacterized protein n=1 Tax=Ditylenchus dipsaci TaxID=166011 RepID=A0A915CM89_9BILA
MFSQGVLQQIQPPGLPLPANMFPFQQQLNVSSSSSTPQLMATWVAVTNSSNNLPFSCLQPQCWLHLAFNPQFMAAAAAAAGGLLPNLFTGGPGAPPPKALLPPPSANPPTPNFQQQNFPRGGGRGGGRGGHWNGPADSFANSPGGFGGAGGQDFRNNESGFRGNRGGRFNSFPTRGGPPSNNNFRGGRFNSGYDRPPSLFDAPPVRHHQDQQFGSGGFPPRHAFSNSGRESTAPPNQKSPSGGAGLLPTPLFPPATTRQFTRFSSINDTSAGDSAAPGTSPPASFTQHTPMAAEDVKQASESLSNSMREQHDRNQPFTSGGQETEEFTVSTTQQVEQQPRDMPTQQHHNQGRNQSEVSRAEVEVSSTTFHDEHQQQQLVGAHADSVSQPQQQPQPKEHQLFEQEQKQENTAQEAPQTTED